MAGLQSVYTAKTVSIRQTYGCPAFGGLKPRFQNSGYRHTGDRIVYIMNTTAVHSDWRGRVVDGKFTLRQWLGGSELSGVFLTELPEHPSQKAAIKLIEADARGAEAQIACWAATTPLSHPHLMRLFQTGRCQIDGAPLLYAVTEYSDEILSQILPERPLTPAETREMLDPILNALAYLHGKGFVHGHLKPSNILVVDDQLKLSSDGLMIASNAGRHFSATEVYDAPEAASGNLSPAADVWSLGVTLVEILTQHLPVWDREAGREPVVPESIPQPFAGIARACLRLDPARRCTLSDVKARLEPARSLPKPAHNPGKTASKPASKTAGETEAAKSHSTAIVVAVLVLIAIIAIVQLWSHKTSSSSASLPTETQQSAPESAAPKPQASVPGTRSSNGAAENDAVVERVMPDVLPGAQESIRGQVNVSVRVSVDANGNVTNATLDSAGPSKYFAKVALQAAQQWKFKPAAGTWILQFQFTQAGNEVTPVEAAP
jgi:TonB family protein